MFLFNNVLGRKRELEKSYRSWLCTTTAGSAFLAVAASLLHCIYQGGRYIFFLFIQFV
ncbi:hypothetical protein SAMN05444410_11677 [Hydrobacter penzbergensis]|uniref:Uncharacterized protein n=1 Tax=Hydrobacter penzbergensis TaxID=1235997 RepID=A0A8X8IF40_9BACT|nr:hypothetical protein CLV53_104186 [Sediminibacterium magnilacihabitans]SDX45893.1 hypothetical protein SAMN05444410_11677 [Hydrobacter penzbergensis]